MSKSKIQRPVFLNLAKIQMPVGAVTSILHRITGIVLALYVPLSLYLLDLSLQGPQQYERVIGLLENWAFRIALILAVWALTHHVFAGIRHLLSDIDIGSQLLVGRRSAWIVNLGALAMAVFAVGLLI
jgi:succinate dehydrogenase / fumarate reductase, cytochrome b subunit